MPNGQVVPDLSGLRVNPIDPVALQQRTQQQAQAELPQPYITPPWEEEPKLPDTTSTLGQAYSKLKSFIAEHEQHVSEKYLAPFRESLDAMAEDIQQAAESGHTRTGGQLTGPTRALAEGVGTLLKQVPVGKNARETALAMATLPELPEEQGALAGLRVRRINASGESAASLEAINRLASEKAQGKTRVSIDTRSGQETPLIGADAVDAKPATPYHRIVQRTPNGDVVIAEGAKARPVTPPSKVKPATQTPKGKVFDLGDINDTEH